MIAPVRPPARQSPRRALALLFDLDGTLIDSIGLLLASMRHAFDGRTGARAPTEPQWIAGIGTPLATQLADFADSPEDVAALVARYRGHQREHHDALTRAYPGIVDALAHFHAVGHPIGIVTSKAEEIARLSLAHVGLAPFVDTLVGVESSARHKPDPEPVRVALARLGVPGGPALFVGDSPHDVGAGNAAGVATAAVLWGPFDRAALEGSRPTYWLQRVDELVPLVERLEREAARAGGA